MENEFENLLKEKEEIEKKLQKCFIDTCRLIDDKLSIDYRPDLRMLRIWANFTLTNSQDLSTRKDGFKILIPKEKIHLIIEHLKYIIENY